MPWRLNLLGNSIVFGRGVFGKAAHHYAGRKGFAANKVIRMLINQSIKQDLFD
jgi:hypothetical protein